IIILYLILGPLILSSFPTRRSSDLFNFAAQYTDKFHFGMNLNAHFVNYERSNAFFENNDNPVFPDGETTREIWYQNDLYTYGSRSEEHTSELQSRENLVCRLLLEKK